MPRHLNQNFTGILFLLLTFCFAEIGSGQTTSADTLWVDTIKRDLSTPLVHIPEAHFNPGIIHHAMHLIQGKAPGAIISRAGGNPQEPFSVLFRGVSTFYGNPAPLLVIDGIPAAFEEALDPDDIAAITLLTDPVQLARYGARGAAGVVSIQTKNGAESRSRVRYSGSIGLDQPIKRVEVLDATTFLRINGSKDLGSATHWFEAVTRTGSAQVHHLDFSGHVGQGTYRAALHLRDVQSILTHSGFQRLNARLSLYQPLLQERVGLSLQVFSTTGEATPGDPNTFRYAFNANPTMPIYAPSGSREASRFGGYAQRDVFDAFNPVALIAQNFREDHLQASGSLLRGTFSAAQHIDVYVQWSAQQLLEKSGRYSSKTSLYGGGYHRNGLATLSELQHLSSTIETGLQFKKQIRAILLSLSGNYFFQHLEKSGSSAEAGNFLTDAFRYHNLGAALDIGNGISRQESYKSSRSLNAFTTDANIKIRDIWSISAVLRYEGASPLGRNARWGLYPALSTVLSLTPVFKLSEPNRINLYAGIGLTGNLPRENYLSQQPYGPSGTFYFNGAYRPTYAVTSNGNPDLGAERTRTITMGIDFVFSQNRINGRLGLYQNQSTNLILPVQVPVPPNVASYTWMNAAALKNAGIESQLDFLLAKKNRFSWRSALNLSTFQTLLQKLPLNPNGQYQSIYFAAIGGPGQGDSESAVVPVPGERLGIIRGPLSNGIGSDGRLNLQDLSGDGRYCYCSADHTGIGNGLPRFAAGLGQELTLGKFQFVALFRAVLGHDLLNTLRLFYENTASYTLSNYNIVRTKYYNPSLKQPVLSDVFVEKGNFLEVQHVRLSYTVPVSQKGPFADVVVHLTGQHLALFSPYTGIHPEVRIPGPDMLAPGIERRDTYLPVRTFSLGANVLFR